MLLKLNTLMGTRLQENPLHRCTDIPVLRLPGREGLLNISSGELSTHTLMLGSTGTGKTNTILHFISQLKASLGSEDVMLIFDSKLDFRRFQNRNDLVITNSDSAPGRKCSWNIFEDLIAGARSREDIFLNADEMAQLIFSRQIETSNQPFFPSAARDIFAAILKAICCTALDNNNFRQRHMNNESLCAYLRSVDAKKLSSFLNSYPRLQGVMKYVGDGSSDQALGVFAELQSATSRLFVKCFGGRGSFSLRKTEAGRNGKCLFIEYDPASGESLRPIYRLICDLFLKEALSNQRRSGHVYFVVDELKMLPSMDHFEDALNFGRSLGISVIAGIQSMEQLYEVYGEYGGRNIASGFQNIFSFRTNNGASREYIKGLFGKNLCSYQYSGSNSSVVCETREGSCVEDWDITSLNKGEAIISIDGGNPFRFQTERFR